MNAYSQNLREKIVEAVFERGMGKSEVARAFVVSLPSVKRYAKAGNSLASPRGSHFPAPATRPRIKNLWPNK